MFLLPAGEATFILTASEFGRWRKHLMRQRLTWTAGPIRMLSVRFRTDITPRKIGPEES